MRSSVKLAYGNMINRCYNPKCWGYKWYGAEGVGVSQSWLDSYDTFVRDMGPHPGKGYSLDRIDRTKDYGPTNCRWATARQQMVNRRIPRNNTSGYRGVYWCKYNKKWIAELKSNYKKKRLGYFNTPIEAAKAYDREAIRIHGDAAQPNFQQITLL